MVPQDMNVFRRKLSCTESINFDFFQPLENLRGMCLANFFLSYPEVIQKEIESLDNDEGGELALSLVEEVCGNDIETRTSLMKEYWIRSAGEPCYDPHFNNLLNHAFADENLITSLKQIISHMLSI